MAAKSIAFVCIGNACRSQMAEGFAKANGPADLTIYSAGSHPAGFVAQQSIRSMQEKGIDISEHYSKGIDDLPAIEFDYVVTMGCGDNCPTLKAKNRLDWAIPDPIGQGEDYFRQVRDTIEANVRDLLQKT